MLIRNELITDNFQICVIKRRSERGRGKTRKAGRERPNERDRMEEAERVQRSRIFETKKRFQFAGAIFKSISANFIARFDHNSSAAHKLS